VQTPLLPVLLADDRLTRTAVELLPRAAALVEDEEAVLDPGTVDTAVGLLRELAARTPEFSDNLALISRRGETAANRPSRELVAALMAEPPGGEDRGPRSPSPA
jgi:hypothetical protein